MADQGIPATPPFDPNTSQLPPEWRMFIKELLRRLSELEQRVTELEP